MSLDVSPTSSLTERSDSELIDGTRAGSQDAYAELWRRHSNAGRTVARSITSSIDPDDLVSESFARIYQAVRRGKGPTGAFRPYLFTTIRNTAAAWGRARRETSLDTLDSFEDPDTNEASSIEALDRSLSARAFRSLPTRWQEVLWYTEIEGMTPAEVAPLLGMKANSVSALSYRAREGLREAWIQAHLRSVDDDSEHAFTISRLGSYARGNLAARDTAKVEAHLDTCQRCTIVAAEAKEVGSRMALVLLPLVAGAAGAAGYTAWLQTDGHTAATIAAMPAGVTGGALLTTHLGAHAAGSHAVSAVLPETATHLGAHAVGATTVGAHVGGGHAAGGLAVGAASTTGGAGGIASGGTAASGTGTAGTAGAAAAGTAVAGTAAAGISGGIIAAIVVGIIAAGTAAALVVGPMVFPASGGTDTSVVAQDPAPAPAAPTPITVPAAPSTQPTPPVPAPVPAPLPEEAGDDGTADVPSDPDPVAQPATPPTLPTAPPITPTTPPVDPNTDPPSLPVVTDVDLGGGYVWPVISGTAPVGATIDILSAGEVVATTTVGTAQAFGASDRAAATTGSWTSGPVNLGSTGPFSLVVQQTIGGRTTQAPTPVTGQVAAPTLNGLVLGYFQLNDRPITASGVPNGIVRYSIDGAPAQDLVLDDAGVSQAIESTPAQVARSITLQAVDPENAERTGPISTINYLDTRSIRFGAAEPTVTPTDAPIPAEETTPAEETAPSPVAPESVPSSEVPPAPAEDPVETDPQAGEPAVPDSEPAPAPTEDAIAPEPTDPVPAEEPAAA